MFVCDFVIKYQFLGLIVQRFSHVLDFTTATLFSVDEFPDLCNELNGTFRSHFFALGVSEIRLLCTCEGCSNDT